MKTVFQIFMKFNISIKLSKNFLIYFSMRFLKQKINFLKFTTDENKFPVISNLKFSLTLRQLKHYLELTDWLWKYVKKYAKISESLQNKKTIMFKKSFVKKSIRRFYFVKIAFQNFIKQKIVFFKSFQKSLFSFRYLIYFVFARQLYMNVDVSKKENIKIIIYHSKQIIKNYSFRIMIKFIMFLNRQITDSEFKYWFIELKLTDLIWILRKIRYMIESIFLSSIIYTDHEIVVDISKQKSLSVFFIDKLCLQLVRVFEYIQRFNLIIKHK